MEVIQKKHKSIIDNSLQCYHCGKEYDLQRHHICKGLAYRWKAEEDGLWCYLCIDCHTFLHGKDGHELDVQYKQIAERTWLKHYRKTVKDWIRRYGKNYLD